MPRQNRRERFWTTPWALARRAEGRMPESTVGMRESGVRMVREKAVDGFFNRKLVRLGEYLADVFPGLCWQYFRIAIPKQGHYEFFIAVDSK